MTTYLSVPREVVVLLLAPAGLLMGLTAIYSYYLGWLRYQRQARVLPTGGPFRDAGRIVITVLAFSQLLALTYCIARDKPRAAGLLALSMLITVIWGFVSARRRLGYVMATESDVEDDPRWRMFRRRFRIFVFSLILALPSGLALLCFIIVRDLPTTILVAGITLATAPWALRKIRAEVQPRRDRE